MTLFHLDGHPIIYRAYYWGALGWRGYSGSDVLGTSYGLCQPLADRHRHRTQAAAIECARRTAARSVTRRARAD